MSLTRRYPAARSFVGLVAICPHCEKQTEFKALSSNIVKGRYAGQLRCKTKCWLHTGRCRWCKGIVIGAGEGDELTLLWPQSRWLATTYEGIDEETLADYLEAVAVLPHSSRAAALLARRALAAVLRNELEIERTKFGFRMEEASNHRRLSEETQEAINYMLNHAIAGPHLSRNPKMKYKPDPALQLLPMTHEEAIITIQTLELVFHDLYYKEVDPQLPLLYLAAG